uniref:Phosphodiester glycosidase domain-containing protein n=2 Tax=unclassified Prevotella TaxID=2638335 RepID=A0AB33IVZ4_9BACT
MVDHGEQETDIDRLLKPEVMKSTILYSILSCIVLFTASCSDSSDNADAAFPHKGAKTALMQNIADNLPELQRVEKDSMWSVTDGVNVTEVKMVFRTYKTHMLIAEVDLTKNLTLAACCADNAENPTTLQPLTGQIEALEKAGQTVYAGVNGDFFGKVKDNYQSMNVFVKDGKAIKDTYTAGNEGMIVKLKNGDIRIIHPRFFKSYAADIQDAIGGFHALITDGETNDLLVVNDLTMAFAPRTFVGLSQDGKKCYLFVVDGQQDDFSKGIRVEDAIGICKHAGCHNALNLDGGASSTFAAKDGKGTINVLNKPSDGEQRPIFNGLVVIKKG